MKWVCEKCIHEPVCDEWGYQEGMAACSYGDYFQEREYFHGVTKMVPLTPKQLRKMGGQQVFAVSPTCVGKSEDMLKNLTFYAYPPAAAGKDAGGKDSNVPTLHIDREAWKPCKDCRSCKSCRFSCFDKRCDPCRKCKRRERYEPRKFCPSCGRPLTEEAWAELEMRLRG